MPRGIKLGANGVTIGANIEPIVTLDVSHANDAIALPSGNTAQRPPGVPGEMRFNRELNQYEGVQNDDLWHPLGGGVTVQNNNVVVNTASTLDIISGANAVIKMVDDYPNNRIEIIVDVLEINVNASIANAYAQANAAYAQANLAYAEANTANAQANAAYSEANTANALAQSAFTEANTANAVAQSASTQANTALAAANSAQNLVAVYLNGTLVQANSNLNFNTSSTVNAAATANGSGQVNVSFNANTSNILNYVVSANASNVVIQANGSGINIDTRTVASGGNYEVDVFQDGTLVVSNASLNVQNSATINVSALANGSLANIKFNANLTAIAGPAYGQANAAYTQANAAYAAANTAANTVVVYQNNALILAQANLNFNNTATINVLAGANGTEANVAMAANTANILGFVTSANTANIVIQANGAGINVDTRSLQLTMTTCSFNATANQTVFILTANATTETQVLVFINGVEQLPITDYTISANTTLTLTSNCVAGDVVEARVFSSGTTLAAQGLITVTKISNLVLGTANGPSQNFGAVTTLFAVPAVCQRGLVTKFVLTANQTTQWAINVTSQNGAGNAWMTTIFNTANSFSITSPWYYETDLGGDQNMYIAVSNAVQQQNLQVTLQTLIAQRYL